MICTPSLQIAARDLAILNMVNSYAGCTTDQIGRRFWSSATSLTACYRRIAYLIDVGLLHCQRLPSISGVGSGKRFLTLGPAGRSMLAQRNGTTMRATSNHVTPLFVDHHVAIGDFRLALESAASGTDGVSMTEWIGEASLRRRPIRVEVPGEDRAKGQSVTLVPDGAFTLVQGTRRQQCFLEMDMGTIAPKRLHLRVRGYLLHAPPTPIAIFFVTPTRARAKRISTVAETEAQKLGQSPSVFFITTSDRIAPEAVLSGAIWEQVGVKGLQAIIRSNERSVA